jgi:hypothetical protein
LQRDAAGADRPGERAPVSLASVTDDRLKTWIAALDAWGFDSVVPSFDSSAAAHQVPGLISFRARPAPGVPLVLDVNETWGEGDHPDGERSLERDGCHVAVLSWNLRFENEPAIGGDEETRNERLDVAKRDEPDYPIVHRHPLGSPNAVRARCPFMHPEQWFEAVDQVIGGKLSALLP